jgi:hypothetical protein
MDDIYFIPFSLSFNKKNVFKRYGGGESKCDFVRTKYFALMMIQIDKDVGGVKN